MQNWSLNHGFLQIDYSGINARFVLGQNQIQQKGYLLVRHETTQEVSTTVPGSLLEVIFS